MGRFADNIRRIVGTKTTQDNLQPQANQDLIDTARGIAYFSASGATATVTGVPGQTTDPNSAEAIILAATNAAAVAAGTQATSAGGASQSATDAAATATAGLGHGGGGSSPSGPNGTNPAINNSTDGNYTVANVIDKFADSALTFGNDLHGGGSDAVMNALNGWTDCSTGNTGTVRFDGYIPPAGWYTADTPPVETDTTWSLGFAWGTQSSGAIRAACGFTPTLDELGPLAAAYLNGTNPGFTYTYTGATVPGASTAGDCNFSILNLSTMAVTTAVLACARFACPQSRHDGSTACVSTAPLVDHSMWPDSTDFQLVPIDGYFFASQRDPAAPVQYQDPATPQSSVYMCFGSGRKAALQSGTNGTKLLYEIDPSSGAPLANSIIHIYNSDGTLKGYSDIANIDQYTVPSI